MITWRPRCLLVLHPANRARYLHNVMCKAYIYICIYIHRYMCMHTHMCIYILHTHMYVYTHVHIFTYIRFLLHSAQRAGYWHNVMCKSYIYTHICLHLYICMYTYIYMHMYIVHTHIYVNMHTYVFTYVQSLQCCCVLHNEQGTYIISCASYKCIHIYAYIFIHVCTRIHIYIYICTYLHIYKSWLLLRSAESARYTGNVDV